MRRKKKFTGNNNNPNNPNNANNVNTINSSNRDNSSAIDRDNRGSSNRDGQRGRDRYYRENNNRGNNTNNNQASNNPNKNNPQYQLQQFEDQVSRMEKLRESYFKLRKRYFENHHKIDHAQKIKSEQEIFNALKGLRRFEEYISKHYRYLCKKNIVSYEMDTSYATYLKNLDESNHTQSANSTNNPTNASINSNTNILPLESINFSDPHQTAEQSKKLSHKNDCEESIGNMEDYQKHRIEKKVTK